MAYELEKAYLEKLPPNPLSSLEGTELEQALFKASEDLSIYHRRSITPRAIILQAKYNVESSASEYAALRLQGVKSLSTKRGGITFGDNASGSSASAIISPEVELLLGAPPTPIGRLY